MNQNKEKDKIEKGESEMRDLVIARLKTLPSDKKLSVGSSGDFTRDELIEHVEKNDELGNKIVEVQMEYLRLLKEGFFYERNAIGHQAQA